jgi:hypothetical protein
LGRRLATILSTDVVGYSRLMEVPISKIGVVQSSLASEAVRASSAEDFSDTVTSQKRQILRAF